MTRHVLDVDDLSPAELIAVLDAARTEPGRPLEGQGVALVMGLPSARTRNATELAVVDLGGHPVTMGAAELGIDERETAEDVARTLAQYHRVLCARVASHDLLVRMAAAIDSSLADVPVVNLLSDRAHPVQALADMLTIADAIAGSSIDALQGRRVAWVGDANNVATSFALAACGIGLDVVVATPTPYAFDDGALARFARFAGAAERGGSIHLVASASEAVAGASAVCTDVWVSMGQAGERDARLGAFRGFQIDESLLDLAADGAVLLHCLPAHRGEEVTAAALDSARSVVWAQAANRRDATRGLLAWLTKEGE